MSDDAPTEPDAGAATDRDPPSGEGMVPPDPLLGVVLEERYEITRLIMAGGMGATYLARDLKLHGKEVVVKVPDAKLLRDREFRRRFRREVQHLIALEHKHVVKVLDAGIHDRQPYVVLQYIRGGDLKHRLKRSSTAPRPSARTLVEWFRSIARALDYLHRQGTVHRDVKPENILIDGDDAVYLADFGIAKAVEHSEGALTETGITPGTPQYMAPEQAEGGGLTGRTDQYALAVTAYEAFAGRLPHVGETPVAILMSKLRDAPQPLDDLARRIPTEAASALTQALARRPAERFPSCTAFVSALARGFGFETSSTDVAPSLATAPVQAPPTEAREAPGGASPHRLRILGALVLVAAVVAGLFAWRPWDEAATPADAPPDPGIARGGSLDADEATLRTLLRELTGPNLEGRGTPRARRFVAEWLARSLWTAGFERVPGQSKFLVPARRDDAPLYNVYGWLPGSQTPATGAKPYVLVLTHFDGLGIKDGVRHPSADNNGSGVAALLELARILLERGFQVAPARHAFLFAFLDRHQDKVAGARHLAEKPPLPLKDCLAVVGIEQLGRSLLDMAPGSLLVMGGENTPDLLELVQRHPVQEGGVLLPVGRDLYHGIPDIEPFRKQRIPSLFVMAGPSLDFGNANDTYDRIDFAWLTKRTDWLRDLAVDLAALDTRPVWVDDPEPRIEEVRAVRQAIAIAVDNPRTRDEIPEMARTQVRNFTRTIDRILTRGTVTRQERRTLVNMAKVMWVQAGVWRSNAAGLRRGVPAKKKAPAKR